MDVIANEIRPDLILWTGDNPPHNIYQDTSKEILAVTQAFVDLIQLKFNYTIPVYPAVGNHEEYPNDQFNLFENKTSGKWFLKTIGDIYKPLLTVEAYQSFISYGYYSMLHPNSNLRVISMNCLLCDTFNLFLLKNPTDPLNQVNI